MKRRWLALAAFYALLLGGGWALGQIVSQWAAMDLASGGAAAGRMVWLVSAVYVVASALPFVPGAEIGLGLIAMFGGRVALLVYLCMVAALLAAFCVGRFVPAAVTASMFGRLGLEKARRLVLRMAALDPAGRAALLAGESPQRWAPFLLRHRYLAFAVALNLPGNTLLGGGGGLALAAGMSGLFAPAPFLATVLLAVAPLPLFVLLSGYAP